jgi:hypothetical protein
MRDVDLSDADLYRVEVDETVLSTLLRELRLDCTSFEDCMMAGVDLAGASGSIGRSSRINVGDTERAHVLHGDALLAWRQRSGARLTWCDPS